MLVAAIVIPILFFYFYKRTRKEFNQQHDKWLSIGDITEETMITGVITRTTAMNERFFQQKMVHTVELFLKVERKQIKVIKQDPITKNFTPTSYHIGEVITCYGRWNDDHFLANNILVKNKQFE